jgi:hypothetical protein
MRDETRIQQNGVALSPIDEWHPSLIALNVNDGSAHVLAHVNVPATLDMTDRERALYKVAYAGTYVDCCCGVGNNDPDWNRMMEQLDQIRYHIRTLMELSENMKTLQLLQDRAKEV